MRAILVLMNKYIAFLTLTFTLACTTPVEKLNTKAAQDVTVLHGLTLTELEKLQKIGTGSCEIGANARTQKSNQIACENYLRNEAAKKEATYIVFTSLNKKGMTTASVEATFYKTKETTAAK